MQRCAFVMLMRKLALLVAQSDEEVAQVKKDYEAGMLDVYVVEFLRTVRSHTTAQNHRILLQNLQKRGTLKSRAFIFATEPLGEWTEAVRGGQSRVWSRNFARTPPCACYLTPCNK